jgi:hypothetical protein
LREAKRQLDERRAAEARPIPRSRPDRLKEAERRLQEERRTEQRANEAYESYRARGVGRTDRRFSPAATPKPYTPPATPAGEVNVTDPDSKLVRLHQISPTRPIRRPHRVAAGGHHRQPPGMKLPVEGSGGVRARG